MGVIVIPCVGKKLEHAAPASEMYQSQFFKALSTFCKNSGLPWYINSAKYGLLHPDEVIEPYNLAVKHNDNMKRSSKPLPPLVDKEEFLERQKQAARMLEPMENRIYLMSKAYCQLLPPARKPFSGKIWLGQVKLAHQLARGEVTAVDLLIAYGEVA